MKKILIAAIAALFAVSAASADAPKFYIDGGIQIPVMGNLDRPDNCDSDIISGFGLDVSFRAMFTESFGLAANLGAYWPLQEELKGSDNISLTIERDDLDEWYGFNGLFGVAIKPVNKEKFGLTIIPGFAFVTEKEEKEIKIMGHKETLSSKSSLFGIGVDVDFDIYLNSKLYLKPSIQTTVLFAGDSELVNESKSWFCITPAFAVGVRF